MSAFAEAPEAPYVNTPYPANANINLEVLSDLNNQLSDDEIIAKIQVLPDLLSALWGEGDASLRRYVPMHHAAAHGREKLLLFLLQTLPSPDLVNLENDNYFTALRYANRSNLPTIADLLINCGAVEELPPITLACTCGSDFIFKSDQQSRFRAQNFQQPKHCTECRNARKQQQQQQKPRFGGQDFDGQFRGGRGGGRGGRGNYGRGNQGNYGGEYQGRNEYQNRGDYQGRGGFRGRGGGRGFSAPAF